MPDATVWQAHQQRQVEYSKEPVLAGLHLLMPLLATIGRQASHNDAETFRAIRCLGGIIRIAFTRSRKRSRLTHAFFASNFSI